MQGSNMTATLMQSLPNGISYVLGLSRIAGPPLNVHLETTNVCNFRCVYCPQSKPDEHFRGIGRGRMSFETFQAIMDRLQSKWRIQRLMLTRDGEPLIHPELERFVACATDRDIEVTISSNGSLITEDRATALIAVGLSRMKGDLCADPEEYDRLRAGGKHEVALAGYRNILEAARKRDADFQLTILDLETYGCADEDESQASLQRLRELFPGYERWLITGPSMMHNALDQSLESFSDSRKPQQGTKKKYNRCHHPWLEMVIDWRGNLVGCCRDLRSEYDVGNILEVDDIDRDLWNGERMRHLRKTLVRKRPDEIDLCAKCDLPWGASYAGSGVINKAVRYLKGHGR